MNRYLAGAVAGTLATIPMSLTMITVQRLIPKKEWKTLPPKQITMEIAEDIGAKDLLDEEIEKDTVSLVNHFAYGAATGVVYAAVAGNVNSPPLVKGIGYGFGGVDGKLSRAAAACGYPASGNRASGKSKRDDDCRSRCVGRGSGGGYGNFKQREKMKSRDDTNESKSNASQT